MERTDKERRAFGNRRAQTWQMTHESDGAHSGSGQESICLWIAGLFGISVHSEASIATITTKSFLLELP